MAKVNTIERIVKRMGSVLTVQATMSITDAAKKMGANGVGCLIVVNNQQKAVGILSERDILNKVVACSANPASMKVSDVMTAPIIACKPSAHILKAQKVMAHHGIRHLPIVEDGIPVGMISSRDILAHELAQARETAKQQLKFIDNLEKTFPGITNLEKTPAGRIVI